MTEGGFPRRPCCMLVCDYIDEFFLDPMTTTFSNAPLIEAIAELRWGAASALPVIAPGQPFTFTTEGVASEEFFMHFGAECSAKGLMRAERILPQGLPAFPGQVVYRFRTTPPANRLLQVGSGVFSANILPPYGNWDSVKEHFATGVDVLIASRPESERNSKFSHVNIRYVNGFGSEYLDGITRNSFLRSLGFVVTKPRRLQVISDGAASESFNLSTTINVSDGFIFQVNVSEGLKDGHPAQIVELSATALNIAPDREEILNVFQSSHDLIEEVFLDMTQAFHQVMEPQRS